MTSLPVRVNALGLDTTEHGDASGVEVILHGPADAAKLRKAGFSWRVEDADLGATMRKPERPTRRMPRRRRVGAAERTHVLPHARRDQRRARRAGRASTRRSSSR